MSFHHALRELTYNKLPQKGSLLFLGNQTIDDDPLEKGFEPDFHVFAVISGIEKIVILMSRHPDKSDDFAGIVFDFK